MIGQISSESIPNPHRIVIRLCPTVAVFVALWLSTAIAYASFLEFSSSNFNIMGADARQVIGRSHFEVIGDGSGHVTVLGQDHFNDGQYDIERDKLELRNDDQLPRMITFEHTFFNANGTLQRVSKADFQTGATSCIQYENGQPQVYSAVLQFPPDTFAGAAMVIFLRRDLRQGKMDEIVLRDFNCVPGPKILKVKAYPQPPVEWAYFPGKVVRVDITPDFGWLNFIAALFVPEIRAVQTVG